MRDTSRSRGRRLLVPALTFLAGLILGAALLRATVERPKPLDEAQRRALRILDTPPAGAGIGDNRIVAAVRRIEPAVVNIDTVSRRTAADDSGNSVYIDPPDSEVRGKGSGVILTPDGFIVTNNHVVEGASRIRVTLPDGRSFFAHNVGTDPQTDLAVLRVDATNLPAAEMADSDRIQVGEWSIAVGNPLGLGSTVTVGVISALNRRNLQIDEGRVLDGAIQTDAAINRGNSGGALANISGQLVGINTAILSSSPLGGSIGLGFAIPSNTVRRVARMLIEHGSPASFAAGRPWIGIQFEPVHEDVAQSLGLSPTRGVSVVRALPESPAAVAGLQDDDIVLAIDGKTVNDTLMVRETVLDHHIGDVLTLSVLRPADHSHRQIRVRLQQRPEVVPISTPSER